MSPTTSRTCPTPRRTACEAWRLALVSVLALALLAIGLAARNPDAHEHVHHDATHPEHACAITLAATGFCDTGAPMPAIAPGAVRLDPSLPQPGSFAWTTPAYWLIPAQAPPARVA